MAKPRKSKNEDPKASVVLHQKLCLNIDMDNHRIFGHTELKMLVPDGGFVALFADDMSISSVTVDGEPAEYEHFPHFQKADDDERKWSSVSCCNTAADAASRSYMSALEKELAPNLLILCRNLKRDLGGGEGQEDKGSIVQNSSGEQVVNGNGNSLHSEDKNVRWVRVVYWIERAEAGVHFGGNMMHTNNQIRRARSWFPCVDNSSQRCTFDMEFTVGTDFVAVSNGNLLYQVLSKDDPSRKTFVYKLSVPICAEWISLAVGRFEILPDSHSDTISHMCLSPNLSKLQNTVGFFHQAFSHYEDYLATSFPFGSYKQIFIQPEVLISSTSLGASMCIFSSHLLFDEKVIDQTIETRIKLAYALARQWFGVYITAEDPTDEWLVEGLAGFLTDSFIKKFLGNNEARYRRYKANCVVCKADISGATALSSSAASSELYGTQSIGLHGKIRSWKAVAVLQMLEKQMGPDSFRKILQNIVYKAFDMARFRTLSTKEFNNLAYKVGNLERPFLKEFFPSWVESCGCPVLRMGLSYIKRKNMIEVAVMRGCSAKAVGLVNGSTDNGSRDGDAGWPGMMSIRVHELDGMYDHPSLPLAGDTWQLLEIQCHSKLASKRIQKPKKGSKPDGSDDNADTVQNLDMRSSMDSPLLWIRVDPDMEYLAEIHFHQPVQMWINQLEKDKDVVAQAQAIATLEKLPQLSFAVVNALNNFLSDSKAFWRVRIEAAYALAHTASEDTDWAGLLHLIKFYKNCRFDPDIGLPRPNDFHDVPEYFVLEAIPHAIAVVKASDKKSPREAVEFVLQLLKYNDNSGNPYSDVFWLSALVQSVGELDFGQQSVSFLSSLLKHIDRLLQFDSLMPSYNGILTISCIRTLAQIALKLSSSVPMERIFDLIKPFRSGKSSWEVRIESSKVLLDLEFYCRGLDATLSLFMEFLEDEPSLRGETKLAVHVMHLCQVNAEESEVGNDVTCQTLVSLLCMLSGKKAFNNIFLRHRLYCIIQIVAGRPPTLYGVPKIQEPMDNKASLEAHSSEQLNFVPKIQEHMMVPAVEAVSEQQLKPASSFKLRISIPQEPPSLPAATSNLYSSNAPPPPPLIIFDASNSKEADTVSNCSERRKNILKIKVKQPGSSSRADDGDHSRGGLNEANNETVGPASSVSVDAPNQDREANEPSNVRHYQNTEEVNSCRDYESWRTWRTTTSIGSSAKLNATDDDGIRELQCTADSMNRNTIRDNHENDGDVEAVNQIQDQSTPGNNDVEVGGRAPSLLVIGGDDEAVHQMLDQSTPGNNDVEVGGRAPSLIVMGGDEEVTGKRKKEKKKDKEKKRRREKEKSNDPEYLERKRQKKEKKRMEKELATKLKQQNAPSDGKSSSLNDYSVKLVGESSSRKGDPSSLDHEPKKLQGNIYEDHSSRLKVKETTPVRKFKLKFKSGVGNV